MNYYNEWEPFCAQWLRNLIDAGLIPKGDVDERDIREVQPSDLDGYVQHHFFAGIAGWSLALELAGWPEDYPVWTGSCPCQDFSNAGRKAGFEGERDMWPAWFRLIRECRPDTVFGEQVDDSLEWYDRTADDLESVGYTVGACVVPACAVGAPHERSRLWFVAHTSVVGQSGPRPHGESISHSEEAFVEADSLVVSVQGSTLPYVCRRHDGISARMGEGIIAGFGNAIVPQVAAEFITAYMECRP